MAGPASTPWIGISAPWSSSPRAALWRPPWNSCAEEHSWEPVPTVAVGQPHDSAPVPLTLAPERGPAGDIASIVFFACAEGEGPDDSRIDRAIYPTVSVNSAATLAEDIADPRDVEEQLRESRRLESVGRLASGIAHDFNNLLTVINGYAERLLQSMESDHPHREPIGAIVEAARRSSALTRQLLEFSRRRAITPEIFDINEVVRNTGNMLTRILGEQIALVTVLDASAPPLLADRGQFEQVLVNLVVNARDAMPAGGELTVQTVAGTVVSLQVRDTGEGMTDDVRQRVFEPFFTTKPPGKGTGLGLAMVHQFVAKHGGTVDVTSQPGAGTTFTISLPAEKAGAGLSAGTPQGHRPSARGSGTILLVEDDAALREVTALSLQSHGYSVLAAADRDTAIRLAREHRGAIDVLLTDVVMPGRGGRIVAQELLAMHGNITIVYMSGYAEDALLEHGIERERVHFIQKPYLPTTLVARIQAAMGSGQH